MNNVVNNEQDERNAMFNHFSVGVMANATRILLMISAVGLLATAGVMLFRNSGSALMIIPLIGSAILMGFGYFLFDAKEVESQGSTAGVKMHTSGIVSDIGPTNEELPDLISGDFEIPIL